MEIVGLVENMSGLKCPYCGKIIDVFKTFGGRETAIKENLRLLATLPLELEVVKEGDAGDISFLDNGTLLITQEFNKMVDEIVKLTDPKTFPAAHSDKDYTGKKIRNRLN
jgi:hypothetical protein